MAGYHDWFHATQQRVSEIHLIHKEKLQCTKCQRLILNLKA